MEDKIISIKIFQEFTIPFEACGFPALISPKLAKTRIP
jgi:hypothetical protein